METTFMTIHSLSAEANILYATASITLILGYQPEEVIGRSVFDYFHPEEVPFARDVHQRGVQMDKAAALHYARIQDRNGQWVSCECIFSVVYNVLVACTSIYKRDAKNERKATQASSVRRIFASSPRDPRYHMLEHLSSRFRTPAQPSLSEPRAALVLNRFSRDLPIMYATDAVAGILGCTRDQVMHKSFYECIQQNCHRDAIKCIESAKENDSVAYLRFWYRDPRRPEDLAQDEEMREASQSSDSDDGGVRLRNTPSVTGSSGGDASSSSDPASGLAGRRDAAVDRPVHSNSPDTREAIARTSSGESTDLERNATMAVFDRADAPRSAPHPSARRVRNARPAAAAVPEPVEPEPYELEAFISCTSDGLVVILRRARPAVPDLQQPAAAPAAQQYPNGFYAAPWAANPIHPHVYQPVQNRPFHHGLHQPAIAAGGPPMEDFMNSIREVAVFAWALTGINGNIASYGHGTPRGEALPPAGIPVWDPYSQPTPDYMPPENQAAQRWAQRDREMSHLANPNDKPPQYSEGNNRGGMGPRGFRYVERSGYYFQGAGSYGLNGFENAYGNPQYQAQAQTQGHYQSNPGNENLPRGSAQGPAGGHYNDDNHNPWQ